MFGSRSLQLDERRQASRRSFEVWILTSRKVFSEESVWKSESFYWLLKSENNGSGKMAAHVGGVSLTHVTGGRLSLNRLNVLAVSTIQSPSCQLAECKTPLSPCPSSKTCPDMGLRTVLTVQKPQKATPIHSTPILHGGSSSALGSS
ncbi:uncharacterized protein TNCV_4948351 [Trichonephila clavipes]|nr:uncharacterized protein TNCV_4948351 [Trichonephila clavipes]